MTDGLNDNTPANPTIPFRFSRLYVTTLTALALLLTVGQLLTQWRINVVQDELYVIRITALQRHQSQQIVKTALQLADATAAGRFRDNQQELREVFAAFETNHLQSRAGRFDDRNIVISVSDSVRILYQDVRPHFEAIQRSTNALLSLNQPTDINNLVGRYSRELLLLNEKPFLELIDAIVRLQTADMRRDLTRLQYIELVIYLLTIAVLIGIGSLIFRPAVRQLRQTILQLVEAEKNTAAINRKLLMLNKSLKITRQKLFEATKQQHQQELLDQKNRTAYLLAGQEEERKRLSRELHDGLGQMLTAVKMQVEALEASLQRSGDPAAGASAASTPAAAQKTLTTLKQLILQTIQETRSISNNLMPTVLSDFGLVPALKMLAETSSRNNALDVTFQSNLDESGPVDVRLDRNVEITLYRISQEAVSNAIRHGQPAHITIELFAKDNYLHLIVADDGRGFRPKRVGADRGETRQRSRAEPTHRVGGPVGSDRSGQGIHNMHERVKLLNGKFRINSVPGKGTRVQVSLPYHSQSVTHEYHQVNAGG